LIYQARPEPCFFGGEPTAIVGSVHILEVAEIPIEDLLASLVRYKTGAKAIVWLIWCIAHLEVGCDQEPQLASAAGYDSEIATVPGLSQRTVKEGVDFPWVS
jgi:hypothetical protein